MRGPVQSQARYRRKKMRLSSRSLSVLGCCLLAAASTAASAQMKADTPPPGTHVSPAASYGKLLIRYGKAIRRRRRGHARGQVQLQTLSSRGSL